MMLCLLFLEHLEKPSHIAGADYPHADLLS